MNTEQLEKLGNLADTIDNILEAAKLPVSPQIHLELIKEQMIDWSRQVKELYIEISGENPWK